ncbi:MAG: tetratricopeptide repeat protein [Candidatus Aminicenantes bacterium]|nr:tetratricopeptide repeat protein [Candidatus Aminicenantes bacterium]
MKKTIVTFIIISLFFCINCRKKSSAYQDYLRPGSPEFLMNEGYALLSSGDLRNAEAKFLKALKKKPNLSGALYALGVVYLNQGKFSKSADHFKRVLVLRPNTIDVYNYLGVIYSETGRLDKAKENFLIAANSPHYKTPENAFANLAMLEIRRGRYESARRYVQKGLIKNNKFSLLLNALGLILEHEDDLSEAIFNFEKAVSFSESGDITFLINMGRVYGRMNQKEKALDVLEQALSKTNSAIVRKQINDMIKKIDK